jgi:translation initiation factor 2 alpha subunit (eIF-2alpha)
MVEEGDIVLCTVEKTEGTTVFVILQDGMRGTIIMSEIAPGRIRNIREYVVPNKKIICKVLRISQDRLDLSLRRVTSKEKSVAMEEYKKDLTAKSILKSVMRDKAAEVEEKVLRDFPSVGDFLTALKENESLMKKYIPAEFIEAIKKVSQKKEKEIEIKKMIKLKCLSSDGIKKIKEILSNKEIQINYISAGNFQAIIKDKDGKRANQKMNEFLADVEKKAKTNSCEYSIE